MWWERNLRRVAVYLQGRGEIGATPKEIRKVVRISPRSIDHLLSELVSQQKARKEGRGQYCSAETPLSLLRFEQGLLGMHGNVFAAYNYPIRAEDPTRSPPAGEGPRAFPVGNFAPWHLRGSKDGKSGEFWESYSEFNRRRVRFRWWPATRTLLVYFATTKNPLTFEELTSLDGWFRHALDPVDPGQVLFVVQQSMNIDYRHLTMDGVKNLRWQPFLSSSLQAYNKEGRGLRVEAEHRIRKGPEDVPYPKMFESLLALDPRNQLAKSNLAVAKATEEQTAKLDVVADRIASVIAERVEAALAQRLGPTPKKGPTGPTPPEAPGCQEMFR